MPAGNVRGAVAVATFPITLSTKFTESHAVLANVNEYHDGTTQRTALVAGGRRTWSLPKRLTVSEILTLRAFWEANQNTAFNFYNPFETVPPFARNPSGSDGLYIVRFASDWDEQIGMVRSDASAQLIEVADDAEIAAARLAVLSGTGTAIAQSVTLSIVTASTTSVDYQAFAAIGANDPRFGGSVGYIFSNDGWTNRTDTVFIAPADFDPGSFSLSFAIIGTLFGSGENDLDVYDASIRILYLDGTAVTLRPTVATVALSTGTVANQDNAIDGDTGTFARVQRTSFASLDVPTVLFLSSWSSAA
jgi:hypothetical protein